MTERRVALVSPFFPSLYLLLFPFFSLSLSTTSMVHEHEEQQWDKCMPVRRVIHSPTMTACVGTTGDQSRTRTYQTRKLKLIETNHCHSTHTLSPPSSLSLSLTSYNLYFLSVIIIIAGRWWNDASQCIAVDDDAAEFLHTRRASGREQQLVLVPLRIPENHKGKHTNTPVIKVHHEIQVSKRNIRSFC